MKAEYAAWIEGFTLASNGCLRGMCQHGAQEMVKAFPELTAVPGYALVLSGGKQEHWWCTTADGEIVDPTASQWATPVLEYIPWSPGMEVRVGRCMECGADIYEKPTKLDGGRRSWCSPECLKILEDEFNGVTT